MEKYRDIGFKLTPQRLAILGYLEGRTDHPSAEEIYRAVSKNFPTMSVATVYSALEALRLRGRLLELAIEPGRKRFDFHAEPHHHLICTGCKRVVDIHRSFPINLRAGEKQGFQVTGSHVTVYGRCPACTASMGTKKLKSKK